MESKKSILDKLQKAIKNQILDTEISVTKLQSLTNNVYRVHIQGYDQSYLYKQYRNTLSEFIDHKKEIFIIQALANDCKYPQIIYADQECRIEKFIKGQIMKHQTIKQQDLFMIIKSLSDFSKKYSHPYKVNYQKNGNCLSLDSLFSKYQQIYAKMKISQSQRTSQCQKYIERLLRPDVKKKIHQILPKIMVLSHNDANLSNVFKKENGSLILLDYEFSSMNYIGFDIGNFFNEFSTDYQTNFEIRSDWQIDQEFSEILIQKYFQQLQIQVQNPKRVVEVGRLLSHLFWLFVGLLQIGEKQIHLDMVYYIKRRYQEFRKFYLNLTNIDL